MLERIIGLIFNKAFSWKFIIAVVVVGALLKMVFSKQLPKEENINLAKNVKLKGMEEFTFQEDTPMIEKVKSGEASGTTYDPRVKVRKGGGQPLRRIYKEKAVIETAKPLVEEIKHVTRGPSHPKKQVVTIQKKADKAGSWGYSWSSSETKRNENFFLARVMEKQTLSDGKPISIKLLEDIPELSLEKGVTLTGPATFLNSARIKIHLTAAASSQAKKKRIDLDCFDSEDLGEGIYSDELARRLEEYAKESIEDEIFDFEFAGKKAAKKVINWTRIASKIELPAGKEIYLAIPKKEKK